MLFGHQSNRNRLEEFMSTVPYFGLVLGRFISSHSIPPNYDRILTGCVRQITNHLHCVCDVLRVVPI